LKPRFDGEPPIVYLLLTAADTKYFNQTSGLLLSIIFRKVNDMAATAQLIHTPRFVRRTCLEPHERNTNFTMFDNEIMTAVSSSQADAVTPLMSKIYLRLKAAPRQFLETDGVL